MQFWWSANGSNQLTASSSVPHGLTGTWWIAATLDVDNGASGNSVKFWKSQDGVAWTQVGTTQTAAGVTSIFSGTSIVEIGSNNTGFASTYFSGLLQDARIYNGIGDNSKPGLGTLVAHFDASVPNTGSTYPDGLGNTWTINGVKKTSTSLVFPGQNQTGLSTPDANAFDFNGDWSVIVNLVGSTRGSTSVVVAKSTGTSASNLDWGWFVQTTTNHQISWVDSANQLRTIFLSPMPLMNTHPWWGVTFQANNGSSASAAKLFWSDNGVSWTQAGANTLSYSPLGIHTGLQQVNVMGMLPGGGNMQDGELRVVRIYNGIGAGTGPGQGSLVADVPLAGNWLNGPQTDPQGRVWTLAGGPWAYVPAP